ncbi:MAG: AAA family ATPase, partial [Actinomycetota bacterium]|nr:AAA family ATPase [Actinomycetota bacterium]
PSERRPVTILFADLVGFSTLAEHLDPEELRTLMTETFSDLTREVEQRGGVVEKFIGDAVMAVFGAPTAHEDDPDRAVEAAVEMLEAVRRRSEHTPTPLRLRIGINSGLVVSGQVGDGTQTGVMGDAVNVAARLQQVADPGEITVSESVWRRVRDGYDSQRIGALEVKGREQPVEAYRVIGPRGRSARRQAPFVGRRDELSLLDLLWSSVLKGNTHVISLIGDPGVGKSRLLSEFPAREGGLDVRIACGGERAFGPFLDLLERILGGIPNDVEDLKHRAADLGVDDETAILVSTLLGLGGAPPAVRMADEQKKRQVFAGVWQLLLGAAAGRPTFIVLDDVHWADRSSLDLLGFLLERLGGAPLMLLLAYRGSSRWSGPRCGPATPGSAWSCSRRRRAWPWPGGSSVSTSFRRTWSAWWRAGRRGTRSSSRSCSRCSWSWGRWPSWMAPRCWLGWTSRSRRRSREPSWPASIAWEPGNATCCTRPP